MGIDIMRKNRQLKVPITRGLVDEIGQELHFALMAMRAGDTSSTSWKSLGKVMLAVSIASDGNDRVCYQDKVMVDSSVDILAQIADRELDTKLWEPTENELQNLAEGALAAESALPWLDYRVLGNAVMSINAALRCI